ncbi:MAG: hypothetical protein OXQ29_27645 [Rhodospirillaceae bacterium]|nr:hypothetical protein [Rhodospirillaceae bacterium]
MTKPKHPIPEARTITLPDKDFQPSKADMEAEYDTPGASLDTIRAAIFRPFNIKREDPDA